MESVFRKASSHLTIQVSIWSFNVKNEQRRTCFDYMYNFHDLSGLMLSYSRMRHQIAGNDWCGMQCLYWNGLLLHQRSCWRLIFFCQHLQCWSLQRQYQLDVNWTREEAYTVEERDRMQRNIVEAEKRLRQKILRTHLRPRIRRVRKKVLTLQVKVNAALMKVKQMKRHEKISVEVGKHLQLFLTEKGTKIMQQSQSLKKCAYTPSTCSFSAQLHGTSRTWNLEKMPSPISVARPTLLAILHLVYDSQS